MPKYTHVTGITLPKAEEHFELSDMTEIINFIINESGATQQAIAKEIGVTQSAVSEWTLGRMTPTLEHFIELVDYCGFELIIQEADENAGGVDEAD